MGYVEAITWITIIGILIVIISYGASRAASVAFFRTKLEYIRSVLKEGQEHNGK